MSIRATSPFPVYLDIDGNPLSQGYVYFGVSGSNPETVPQAVYWDEALTIPAAQPLRTLNGFLVRNGTPASVYLSAVYSITVRNKNRVLLYSSLVNTGSPSSTAMIPVVSAATLALARDALGVSKKIKGYQAISLTHFTDTLEPSITAGSEIEVDGTFYEFPIDETAVAGGWAAIAISTQVYMYLVPAGALHTWIYSATAPTWNTAKQGWYNGANRAFGMLFKDASSLYQLKYLFPSIQAPLPSQTVLGAGSPYTVPLIPGDYRTTVAPFTLNLPAAQGSGVRIRITNGMIAIGLVTITPNGTDLIGPAGNVSIFLQNVDQSGAPYYFQYIELVDDKLGYWKVAAGQYCPAQAVDTNGAQYELGKLHHLPLGNNTSRTDSLTVPAVGSYTTAIQITGSHGVPAGAKAIRARVWVDSSGTTAGNLTYLLLAFSDNNSGGGSAPTLNSAHPLVASEWTLPTGGYHLSTFSEVDIPLNASGQCYGFTVATNNFASGQASITIVGYYMGD
jgi:hypothetical protein